MSASAPSSSPILSLEAIEQLVSRADRRVLFVEPRILRRVIIQDRRIPGLGLRVPHSRVYTIERERLLIIADRSELGLSPAAELPRRMILLARPTDDEEFARLTSAERLHAFWRLAFHGRVHAEVEQRIEDQQLTSTQITGYIDQIGAGEFAEARHVLAKDELLLPPHDDEVAYVEFLAVALELKYFAPWDLPLFFPAIRHWDNIELLWSAYPHEKWYRETQPAGAPERILPLSGEEPSTPAIATALPGGLFHSAEQSSPMNTPLSTALLDRADRSGRVGNHVKAAILSLRAQQADATSPVNHRAEAEGCLRQLAQRLQAVWKLSDEETEDWWQALCPLLTRAAEGYRSLEARILYDLQKVCIAHERGVYRFNVLGWMWTLGHEPLRRELPLLETVQSAKYLRSIADRSSSIRVPAVDRNRLMSIIQAVQSKSDQELRLTVRPLIEKTFDEVGLVPLNTPERVARRKVVEALLDRLVERGFMTMGDLRDALSQSNLKLPDVSGPLELAWGDRLLRADRRLGQVLDGVYRPGAVYLRASQRLSSLAFGTSVGRFLVRHVVLPFGGAYLLLAAVMHFITPHAPPVPNVAAVNNSVTAVDDIAAQVTVPSPSKERTFDPEAAAPSSSTIEPSPPVADSTVPPDDESVETLSVKEDDSSDPDSTVEKIGELAVDAIKGATDAAQTATAKAFDATLAGAAQKTVEAANQARPLPPEFYAAWFVFGLFLWTVLHRPKFRRSVEKFFVRLWNGSRWLVYELPVSVIESPLVRRVLDSRAFTIFKSYLLRPAVVTLFVVGIVRAVLLDSLSRRAWFESFLVLNLFLNSPAGRSVEERVLDICVRAWHELRFRIFAVIYHLVMDLFHDVMQWIEQSLYTVDEWLRFRSGDPRRFVLVKILIGSLWSVISYVIRFVMTLLVEPQINPIKHFPVVTLSHKILLPYTFHLRDLILGSFGVTRMAESTALAIASTIVLLAPGVIGFLVWELKENWQLYVANRSKGLRPTRVGSHGETISGLLRPGFRSGTLAKLYTKLRHALRLESDPGHGYRSTQQLAQIDAVVLAVRRFVEREFSVLIEESNLLGETQITVGRVQAATNRFDLELLSSQSPGNPAIVRWEDLHGWLAARIVSPGWMAELPDDLRERVNLVLTGLYKLAGVDLVREQVLATIGVALQSLPEPRLRIERDVIRFLDHDLKPVDYSLRSEGLSIHPTHADKTPAAGWPLVERRKLLFRDTEIEWSAWVEQWSAPESLKAQIVALPNLIGDETTAQA